jgi:hypothetical protein
MESHRFLYALLEQKIFANLHVQCTVQWVCPNLAYRLLLLKEIASFLCQIILRAGRRLICFKMSIKTKPE